jgi:hypothetical protein
LRNVKLLLRQRQQKKQQEKKPLKRLPQLLPSDSVAPARMTNATLQTVFNAAPDTLCARHVSLFKLLLKQERTCATFS